MEYHGIDPKIFTGRWAKYAVKAKMTEIRNNIAEGKGRIEGLLAYGDSIRQEISLRNKKIINDRKYLDEFKVFVGKTKNLEAIADKWLKIKPRLKIISKNPPFKKNNWVLIHGWVSPRCRSTYSLLNSLSVGYKEMDENDQKHIESLKTTISKIKADIGLYEKQLKVLISPPKPKPVPKKKPAKLKAASKRNLTNFRGKITKEQFNNMKRAR